MSALAGLALPAGRTYDGRDMRDVLFTPGARSAVRAALKIARAGGNATGRGCPYARAGRAGAGSPHEILFLYWQGEATADGGPSAARMGRWKAHWITAPGLGGCSQPACAKRVYPAYGPHLKIPPRA